MLLAMVVQKQRYQIMIHDDLRTLSSCVCTSHDATSSARAGGVSSELALPATAAWHRQDAV